MLKLLTVSVRSKLRRVILRYYSFIIVISWITLFILCILVHQNERLSKDEKRIRYIVYGIVASAALFEWFGVFLSGKPEYPMWLLRFVKATDYILTPFASIAILIPLRNHKKYGVVVTSLLIVNTIFQIVMAFTGGMITIDAQHHYKHGPLYPAYMILYLALIIIVIVGFVYYGKQFRRHNRTSLYAIMIFIVMGILFQELTESFIRTAYLVISIGLALLYIHMSEYSQMRIDDELKQKNYEIMVSQINPHFLFNSLAVIRDLYQDDLDEGDQALVEFSQFLRYNLDSLSKEKLINFADEIANVERYLSLQQMRFGDMLQTSYDLQCTNFKVPSLSIQPIVENAVNHGVRKKTDGQGIVTIRSREFDDRYEVSIIDNGPGFDPNNIKHDDNRAHIGISNVKERLLLSGNGKLEYKSEIGKGTTAILTIPKGDKK